MNLKNNIYILLAAILLSGCDKDATNVKLPKDIKPYLIIHSFISPTDTFISVFVSKTTPIYGVRRSFRDYDPLPGATVKMREASGNWVSFQYDPTLGMYYAHRDSLNIIAGKSYILEVHASGFDQITSTCKVPENQVPDPHVDQISSKKEKMQWGDSVNVITVKTSWKDNPESGNYYRIEKRLIIQTSELNYNPITGLYDTLFNVHEQEGWERYFNKYFDDIQRNGQTISSIWKFQLWPSWTGIPDTVKAMKGFLLLCDENYYRYHVNLEKASESDGNPFAEPVVLKGNIEGGIGIFAAYLTKEFLIQL